MSLERAKDLVQSFNNGDYTEEIEPYFNTLMNFFKFVKKYNLLDELDLGEVPHNDFDDELFDYLTETGVISNLDYDSVPEEFKNHFLLNGLENNYEYTMVFITNNLITDVDIRPDGFYYHFRDGDELASVFCEGGRDIGAHEVAKQILSDEGLGHDWHFDYDSKPSETIDQLNEANLTSLKDIIFKEIGDKELSLEDYNSDFFESLSEEQGTEGYFRIRPQDLEDLLKDSNAFNELCKNELDELGSNLRSLYWQAENSAYEDELYTLVYNGLDEYFEGRPQEVPREVILSNGSKKTRYDNFIKIRNFRNIIETFLQSNKGGYWSDSFLEYFGNLSSLIGNMISNDDFDCVDFRIPEYPDWTLTRKHINEMFHDYI
jgi:hypothetical protein